MTAVSTPEAASDVRSTIGEAEAWYKGADLNQHSALRELITQMIDKGQRTEFENDSYLDALVLTGVMFDRTRTSIRMLSGSGCDGFLTTLSDAFSNAVERLSRCKGAVQIILLSAEPPNFLEELRAKFPDTLKICFARLRDENAPISHFVVCDSKMARIEEPHAKLTQETSVNAIKAKVYFNDPSKAGAQEARFAGFWDALFTPQKA